MRGGQTTGCDKGGQGGWRGTHQPRSIRTSDPRDGLPIRPAVNLHLMQKNPSGFLPARPPGRWPRATNNKPRAAVESTAHGSHGKRTVESRPLVSMAARLLGNQILAVVRPTRCRCSRLRRAGLRRPWTVGRRRWFPMPARPLGSMIQSCHVAGDKTWVAGVEPAAVGEPPERGPPTWGRRPPGSDPSHPKLLPTYEPCPLGRAIRRPMRRPRCSRSRVPRATLHGPRSVDRRRSSPTSLTVRRNPFPPLGHDSRPARRRRISRMCQMPFYSRSESWRRAPVLGRLRFRI